MQVSARSVLSLFLVLPFLPGCSSVYYGVMEKLGKHKRDILVARVQDGRVEQEEAKKQFQTTFEAFKEVSGYTGGELEKVYDKLKSELEASESRAADVTAQIGSIEKVSKDMFSEWSAEIEQFENQDLKSQSQKMLADTQARYEKLIGAMRGAESRMKPVLSAFRDQVRFLKHNLNARAIASLQENVVKIESDVGSLIEEMQKSIDEADSFIASMDGNS